MEGRVLEESRQERDLGIIVPRDMKVSSNCQAAYSRANRIMIKRTISHISERA